MNLEELRSLKQYILNKYVNESKKNKEVRRMLRSLDKLIKNKVKEENHERK